MPSHEVLLHRFLSAIGRVLQRVLWRTIGKCCWESHTECKYTENKSYSL